MPTQAIFLVVFQIAPKKTQANTADQRTCWSGEELEGMAVWSVTEISDTMTLVTLMSWASMVSANVSGGSLATAAEQTVTFCVNVTGSGERPVHLDEFCHRRHHGQRLLECLHVLQLHTWIAWKKLHCKTVHLPHRRNLYMLRQSPLCTSVALIVALGLRPPNSPKMSIPYVSSPWFASNFAVAARNFFLQPWSGVPLPSLSSNLSGSLSSHWFKHMKPTRVKAMAFRGCVGITAVKDL